MVSICIPALCQNMTSSTKAEVHNILHCRQRTSGPPTATDDASSKSTTLSHVLLSKLPNLSYHFHLTLSWLKISECIEYKLLSLAYKVLTTTQPSYPLITVQIPRSTRSSSSTTLVRTLFGMLYCFIPMLHYVHYMLSPVRPSVTLVRPTQAV